MDWLTATQLLDIAERRLFVRARTHLRFDDDPYKTDSVVCIFTGIKINGEVIFFQINSTWEVTGVRLAIPLFVQASRIGTREQAIAVAEKMIEFWEIQFPEWLTWRAIQPMVGFHDPGIGARSPHDEVSLACLPTLIHVMRLLDVCLERPSMGDYFGDDNTRQAICERLKGLFTDLARAYQETGMLPK